MSNSLEKTTTKPKLVFYWIVTGVLAAEFLTGGIIDLLRIPVFSVGTLGYPEYFGYILGTWKILGAVAILAPRFPLLKEWAYAGMFFTMTGAAASLILAGNSFGSVIAPSAFSIIVVISWMLRPPSRRIRSI